LKNALFSSPFFFFFGTNKEIRTASSPFLSPLAGRSNGLPSLWLFPDCHWGGGAGAPLSFFPPAEKEKLLFSSSPAFLQDERVSEE